MDVSSRELGVTSIKTQDSLTKILWCLHLHPWPECIDSTTLCPRSH